MTIRLIIAATAASLFLVGTANAQQSAVSAYIEAAFGALPQSSCNESAIVCTVPVFVAVNTIHAVGDSTFDSPTSGSVRYCEAVTKYTAGPIYGFVALGQQRRSESTPPFSTVSSCELDFNLNYKTMKFIGPKSGNVVPTVVYNLQVLNGMLVGTTPGFTAVIVFGTPSVTRH